MKKRVVDHAILDKAKVNKKDEFYTQLIDIEKELVHYTKHFRNKIVYCNCDNPEMSNFWKYFYVHFAELGLRGLYATFYGEGASFYRYDGKNVVITIKITFGVISYPNQSTKSGAMATVGTVWVKTINGQHALYNGSN